MNDADNPTSPNWRGNKTTRARAGNQDDALRRAALIPEQEPLESWRADAGKTAGQKCGAKGRQGFLCGEPKGHVGDHKGYQLSDGSPHWPVKDPPSSAGPVFGCATTSPDGRACALAGGHQGAHYFGAIPGSDTPVLAGSSAPAAPAGVGGRVPSSAGPVLTREEIERYRQNMKVAEDGGDLWSDEYGAFVKLCDEVLALRAALDVARMRLKNYEPVSIYNGLDIDQWKARADKAEVEVDEAVRWIGVVRDETVLAGYPGGDRTVALANIRKLIARVAELEKELVETQTKRISLAQYMAMEDRVERLEKTLREILKLAVERRPLLLASIEATARRALEEK